MFEAPNPETIRDVENPPARPYAQAQYPGSYPPPATTEPQPAPEQLKQAQTAETSDAAAAERSTLVKLAKSLRWGSLMLLLAFFSFIVMIVSSQVCDGLPSGSCVGLQGFQVAVGTVSFIIALVCGFASLAGFLTHQMALTVISTFLFLWWIAGVLALTFFGNFQTTTVANGYFGAWGSFIVSTFSLITVSARFEHGVDETMHSVRKPLMFLLIASAVYMGASIGPCSPSAVCNGYNAYAMVVGVVSLIIAILLFLFPARIERKTMKYAAWFLMFWWIVGTAVTTLGWPFKTTGNGYFGAYGALLSAVALVHQLHHEV